MKLTADNLNEVLKYVMFKEDEVKMVNGKPVTTVEPVVVVGIVNSFGFHPGRLHERVRDVRTMLTELPRDFFVGGGGGWTFLNLCMKADGTQWTGLHAQQEALACLAIGLGLGQWVPEDRQLWNATPPRGAGVPYVQFDLGGKDRSATEASSGA